ncbi:MAG: DUF86 domain-containing protein [Methanobacteriota archaeon]
MKDDAFYLLHIMDSISKIKDHISGVDYEGFLSSRLIQSAVIRELEIIGEAAKNVSVETKSKHPDIPWRLMSGMRDKLIHDYFGVDLDAVWETVKRDLPTLKNKLADL